jgi:hypothetical protein
MIALLDLSNTGELHVMNDKASATRGTAHEGTATWLRHVPAVLVVALRRKARPHQRDVTCSTWDCDQHGDQQGDGQRSGVLSAPIRCYHSGVVSLRVLLLLEDSPRSLESSPEISFCPEC